MSISPRKYVLRAWIGNGRVNTNEATAYPRTSRRHEGPGGVERFHTLRGRLTKRPVLSIIFEYKARLITTLY